MEVPFSRVDTYYCEVKNREAIVPGAAVTGGQWEALAAEARVWVYAADRVLSEAEVQELAASMQAFTGGWQAHQVPLRAGWMLWGNRVLVVGVDEAVHAASGCSIDALTHAVQSLGAAFGVDWFNRMQVLHEDEEGKWVSTAMHAFWALRKAERVHDDIRVVNPLAKTKGEWVNAGVQVFRDSWHAAMWR